MSINLFHFPSTGTGTGITGTLRHFSHLFISTFLPVFLGKLWYGPAIAGSSSAEIII